MWLNREVYRYNIGTFYLFVCQLFLTSLIHIMFPLHYIVRLGYKLHLDAQIGWYGVPPALVLMSNGVIKLMAF